MYVCMHDMIKDHLMISIELIDVIKDYIGIQKLAHADSWLQTQMSDVFRVN